MNVKLKEGVHLPVCDILSVLNRKHCVSNTIDKIPKAQETKVFITKYIEDRLGFSLYVDTMSLRRLIYQHFPIVQNYPQMHLDQK